MGGVDGLYAAKFKINSFGYFHPSHHLQLPNFGFYTVSGSALPGRESARLEAAEL